MYITSNFQLFYSIYFFVQYILRYLFLILFIVVLSHFLEVKTYNVIYFILILCTQMKSSFWLFYLIYFFVHYFFRYFVLILFIVFSPHFLEVKNIKFLLFYHDPLYPDNKQFLSILFELFLCPIFFQVLISYFVDCFFVLDFGGTNV